MSGWGTAGFPGVSLARETWIRQYEGLSRHAIACEYIRLADSVRILNSVGRPVPGLTLALVQLLAERLDQR